MKNLSSILGTDILQTVFNLNDFDINLGIFPKNNWAFSFSWPMPNIKIFLTHYSSRADGADYRLVSS
jgi:hypothetical protein